MRYLKNHLSHKPFRQNSRSIGFHHPTLSDLVLLFSKRVMNIVVRQRGLGFNSTTYQILACIRKCSESLARVIKEDDFQSGLDSQVRLTVMQDIPQRFRHRFDVQNSQLSSRTLETRFNARAALSLLPNESSCAFASRDLFILRLRIWFNLDR